ncbi:hypothetical protein ACH5RR_025809 [Cinchona calisaya]|uniref:Uncharacterized protein n=1 Tax=Cinchona calisaya TaxID=153742 RepID=A0ABD2Z4Q9_9GENT
MFWKQKGRIKWLKDGAQNSKFYHFSLKMKRNKLFVNRIETRAGVWTDNTVGIQDEAAAFYQDLLTSEQQAVDDSLLDCIPNIMRMEDNSKLLQWPTIEEVKKVVFSMDLDSSARVDGMRKKS